MKLVPLGLREVAVDRRGMDEQGRGREPVVVFREVAGMLAAVRDVGQEFPEGFEHGRSRALIDGVRLHGGRAK